MAHPQDGPHADLRLAIDAEGVTFQVGLNLAFIDEAIALPREALDQVAQVEAEALERGLREFMASRVVVEVDGRVIAPDIQKYAFFAEPEQWMIGVFPKFGARALIRCAITARYPTDDPQIVKVTWPTYPRDQVAAEMEGLTGPDGKAPFMVLEALLQTSDGGVQIAPFSKAKPTIEWHADESGDSRYAAVPPVPTARASNHVSLLGLAIVLFGLPGAIIVMRKNGALLGGITLGIAVGAGVAASLVMRVALVPIPGTGGALELPTDESVKAIFEPLHANLYKAFDHGSEGEIYDALERSVSGPLLKTLYTQVYNSLVQAEQGGMLGIITGVEPLEFEVQSITLDEDGRARIDVLDRWRVEGTVYHWGHSHTRVHEYEAVYTLAGLEQGWRIVDQQMREQRRVDEDGLEPEPARESF
ncbi:MAG: hypothetical protein NCW75_09475 [Phycisphaera sp.]|nr:MAG: hypothetical protein NCW75_09475 [Phycisphaera sp.]